MDKSGRLFSAPFLFNSLKEPGRSDAEHIRFHLVRRWIIPSPLERPTYQSASLNSGAQALIWSNLGVVQIWDLRQQHLLSWLESPKYITALHVTNDCRLMIIGHDNGAASIYDVRIVRQPRLVRLHKLHPNEPVKSIRSNIDNSIISVVTNNGAIFFISATLELVATASITGPILSSTWTSFKTQLLISNAHGELHNVSLPDEMFSVPETHERIALNSQDIITKTQFIGLSLSSLLLNPTASSVLYAICLDRSLRRYAYHMDNATVDQAEILATHEMVSFSGLQDNLSISEDRQLIASCNTDGCIILKYGHNHSQAISISPHNSEHGGALSVSLCSASSTLLSAGADGAVFCFTIPDSIKSYSSVVGQSTEDVHISIINEEFLNSLATVNQEPEQVYKPNTHNEQCDRAEVAELSFDAQILVDIQSKLSIFNAQLCELIAKNDSCPEIDKLDISELVIDKQLETEELRKGDLHLKRVQREIENDKMRYEILYERLKHSLWDAMEIKEMMVRGLQSAISVNNFPIVQQSQQTAVLRARIQFLRSMQILERQFMSDEIDPTGGFRPDRLLHQSRYVFECGVSDLETADRQASAPSGTDTSEKTLQKSAIPTKALTLSAVVVPSSVSAFDRIGLHPITLWSEQKKIMQSIFIEMEIEKLSRDFDTDIQALYNARQGEVEKIDELRKTIVDVSLELGIACDANSVVTLRDQPNANSILEVHDSEITSPIFLSNVELEKKLLEDKENAETDALRKADNAAERALKEMMNGTLESKRSLSALSFEIDRPKFMDGIPEASWSEEEKQIAAAYVEKCNAQVQEREARKKQLEALSKKCRNDIFDIIRSFDERVDKMKARRLKVHSRILLLELSMIQLQNELLAIENRKQQQLLHGKQIEDFQNKKQEFDNVSTNLRRNLDTLQKQHEQIHSDLRQTEKGFRKEFADAGSLVETLFKLFRNKKNPVLVNMGRTSQSYAQDVNLDPFSRTDDRVQHEGLNVDNDLQSLKPAELSVSVWDRFVEKRSLRLSQEQMMKVLIQDIETTEQRLDGLESQQSLLQAQLNELADKKEKSYQERAVAMLNTLLMMKAKQGQVEIDENPLITDLQDCQLIDRSIVENFNEKIVALGKEKVSTLKEITEFRKGINMLIWSRKSYDLTLQEYQAQSLEFQTLRVTKALQEIIKVGGHETRHANEIEQLQQKKAFLTNIHLKKMAESRKNLFKLKKKVRSQQTENERLSKTIEELQGAVESRSQIISTKHGHEETENIAKKMKALSLRRNLIDLVHVQSAEIDYLRKDLESMRKKIFPSFAHIRKHRKRIV